jgi:hypothetical protein
MPLARHDRDRCSLPSRWQLSRRRVIGTVAVLAAVGLLLGWAASDHSGPAAPSAPLPCPDELPIQPAGKPPRDGVLAPRRASAVRICRYQGRAEAAARSLIAQTDVSHPSQVSQLRTHLNRRAKVPPGVYHCPAYDQGGVVIAFNSGETVVVPLSGCRRVWSTTAVRQLSPGFEAELISFVPPQR